MINLGFAFGAGLYESRIVVPQWLSGSQADGVPRDLRSDARRLSVGRARS